MMCFVSLIVHILISTEHIKKFREVKGFDNVSISPVYFVAEDNNILFYCNLWSDALYNLVPLNRCTKNFQLIYICTHLTFHRMW
jgi:hypothetical protein